MIATLSCSGLLPSERAITGSAVAMIVESRFCMNIAQATISEMTSWREGERMRQAYTALTPRATLFGMIENRLFVLILQHPQEKRQALSTAAKVTATLTRAKVAVGLSWPNLPRALGREADPRRWGVLYLGSARPTSRAEIVALDRDNEAFLFRSQLADSLSSPGK